MNTQALATGSEFIRQARYLQINPLRNLTAQSLVRALNNFDAGELREAALLFEAIAQRDDVIPGVKSKREKEVAQLDCVVGIQGESTPEAEEHKRILEEFWANVEAVNALDRDERGGFKMLVKQMMRAVSFRWAVHHIVWQPRSDGTLRAMFQYLPLWLFENKEGALRFRADVYGDKGEVMPRDRWMVTRGDGLMYPCAIGYFFKRSALNHLAIYSGKFSVPNVVGATSGSADSPEGKSMKACVQAFESDNNSVLYNAPDPSKVPLHIIESNGNPNSMPMPAVTERADRTFSALYRGADLSTMSSKDGRGQGASLQGGEKDILKGDDKSTIEESIAHVSRMVIEWHFGPGVDPLAKVKLEEDKPEARADLLKAATILADRGVPVSVSALASDLKVPLASADEESLQPGRKSPEKLGVNARPVLKTGWKHFGRKSGSLKIPRAEMPQLKGGDHAAFVNFLKSRGIETVPKLFKARKLKPTQSEFSPKKAKRREQGGKSILVSADGYVLDGHHAWVKAKRSDGMVKGLHIDAPILRLLSLASAFPSSRMVANANPAPVTAAEEKHFRRKSREMVDAAILEDLQPVIAMLEKAGRADSKKKRDALLAEADELFDKLAPESLATSYESILASALTNGWAQKNEGEN